MKILIGILLAVLTACAAQRIPRHTPPKHDRYILDVSKVKTLEELKRVINSLNIQILLTKEEFDSTEIRPFRKYYKATK